MKDGTGVQMKMHNGSTGWVRCRPMEILTVWYIQVSSNNYKDGITHCYVCTNITYLAVYTEILCRSICLIGGFLWFLWKAFNNHMVHFVTVFKQWNRVFQVDGILLIPEQWSHSCDAFGFSWNVSCIFSFSFCFLMHQFVPFGVPVWIFSVWISL